MNTRVSIRRRPRAALTMIELLVAIAILGLLMALVIPAVQQARTTARRMECKSNLHQIGVAMHNFLDAEGNFPASGYNRDLLPYLEQGPFAEEASGITVTYVTLESVGSDERFRGASFSVLACPSDPAQSLARERALSYRLNTGTGWGDHDDGFLRRQGGLRPRDVTDGLSQTAAFSERLLYRGPQEAGIPPGDAAFTPTPDQRIRRMALTDGFYGDDQMDEFADACRDHATWFAGMDRIICTPLSGGCSGFDYNHIMTPNQQSCFNGVPSMDFRYQNYASHTASSMHYGGVNVLLGDGAVHFVSDSVDRSVWWALGTRAGEETNALNAF